MPNLDVSINKSLTKFQICVALSLTINDSTSYTIYPDYTNFTRSFKHGYTISPILPPDLNPVSTICPISPIKQVHPLHGFITKKFEHGGSILQLGPEKVLKKFGPPGENFPKGIFF